MRLYDRTGASSVHHEDFGAFHVIDGVIDVPDPLGVILHRTHIDGAQAWETDAERVDRLAREDLARRQDPATLLAAVEALTAKVADQARPRRAPRSKTP